jgi:hypothetical protein
MITAKREALCSREKEHAMEFDDLADLDDLDDLDDMIGSLEIGARRRRGGRRGRGRGRSAASRGMQRRGGVPARRLIPRVPGVPMPGARLQPLGFGSSAFTVASGTVLSLTASPQRPFKGQRLVVDITRTGASATGLITITRLDVGTANQLVSSGPLAAAAFAATAFDVNLELDPATPGILIVVQLAISVAPAGADRVDFAAVMFGTAVG